MGDLPASLQRARVAAFRRRPQNFEEYARNPDDFQRVRRPAQPTQPVEVGQYPSTLPLVTRDGGSAQTFLPRDTRGGRERFALQADVSRSSAASRFAQQGPPEEDGARQLGALALQAKRERTTGRVPFSAAVMEPDGLFMRSRGVVMPDLADAPPPLEEPDTSYTPRNPGPPDAEGATRYPDLNAEWRMARWRAQGALKPGGSKQRAGERKDNGYYEPTQPTLYDALPAPRQRMPREMRPVEQRLTDPNEGVRAQAMRQRGALAAAADPGNAAPKQRVPQPDGAYFSSGTMEPGAARGAYAFAEPLVEMTGAPSLYRGRQAAGQGDWSTWASESANGALGLFGMATGARMPRGVRSAPRTTGPEPYQIGRAHV